MEHSESHDFREMHEYPYDAVIVLGGGLNKVGEKYYPTDYRQGDEFGMLGAGMRMVAAVDLYLDKKARQFVFSTGVTEKNKAKFGPDVPTEAEVYKQKFLRSIEGLRKRKAYQQTFYDEENPLEEPIVIAEDQSFDTLSNLKEVLQIIQDKGWSKIAIVSSYYHIPRIEALYKQALEQYTGAPLSVEFLDAEGVVKKSEPGKYDDKIATAYESDTAEQRILNESKGLQDIKSGRYPAEELTSDKE